ncbi:MAG: 30S ribosome-binding factor RbfA [Chlorobi bacterium]|nr:30S ribosome-binding factor RbfA [Chlorobiota bacterium]
METTGQKRISALIQKELSIIFQKKAADFAGKIISVTVVRVTPDLSLAKVYLSIFPDNDKDAVFEEIQNSKSVFRFELGNKIKNKVRKIPDLRFFIDDSLDYAEKIDNLLNK